MKFLGIKPVLLALGLATIAGIASAAEMAPRVTGAPLSIMVDDDNCSPVPTSNYVCGQCGEVKANKQKLINHVNKNHLKVDGSLAKRKLKTAHKRYEIREKATDTLMDKAPFQVQNKFSLMLPPANKAPRVRQLPLLPPPIIIPENPAPTLAVVETAPAQMDTQEENKIEAAQMAMQGEAAKNSIKSFASAVYCDCCELDISQKRWDNHIRSDSHAQKEAEMEERRLNSEGYNKVAKNKKTQRSKSYQIKI